MTIFTDIQHITIFTDFGYHVTDLIEVNLRTFADFVHLCDMSCWVPCRLYHGHQAHEGYYTDLEQTFDSVEMYICLVLKNI